MKNVKTQYMINKFMIKMCAYVSFYNTFSLSLSCMQIHNNSLNPAQAALQKSIFFKNEKDKMLQIIRLGLRFFQQNISKFRAQLTTYSKSLMLCKKVYY